VAQIHKDAIIAVDIWRANRLAIDRNEAMAFFACRFGEQLLDPCAEIVDGGRGKDGDLVAATLLERSQDGTEDHAGVRIGPYARATLPDHVLSAAEELRDVQALNRGGDEAEVRERRIAAADCGLAVKDVTEAVRLSNSLHLRTWVSDRDEALPCLGSADDLLSLLEEILFENVWFQRAAGLTGNDEDRLGGIDLLFDGADLRRIGGIEDEKFRAAGDSAKG
jgi:hypothetical protein